MTTDIQASGFSSQALQTIFSTDPEEGEVVGLQAVSFLETHYGDSWKGAGAGSHNQGAIQCGSQWTGDKFSYTDTHPNDDGTSTPYTINFRKYATDVDGWEDLTKVAYIQHGRSVVRDAARAQNWFGISQGLHDTGYYEGFGKTVTDRINNHFHALMRGVNAGLAAFDQSPVPVIRPAVVIPITVRRGMFGAAVAELQRELRISADGCFGKYTEQALITYQKSNNLKPDGVCGEKTWTAILTDDYIPIAA